MLSPRLLTPRLAMSAALVTVLAASLAACAGTDTAGTAPVPSATVTTAPAETAAAVIASGATLTAAQLADLPDGVRAYTMMDSSAIAVVRGEPVPQIVVDDIAAEGVATLPALNGPAASSVDDVALFEGYQHDVGRELGRRIVWVVPVTGVPSYGDGATTEQYWSIQPSPDASQPTREAALALAETYAASAGVGNVVVVYDFVR